MLGHVTRRCSIILLRQSVDCERQCFFTSKLVNTRVQSNAELIMVDRLRRWTNIELTLGRVFVVPLFLQPLPAQHWTDAGSASQTGVLRQRAVFVGVCSPSVSFVVFGAVGSPLSHTAWPSTLVDIDKRAYSIKPYHLWVVAASVWQGVGSDHPKWRGSTPKGCVICKKYQAKKEGKSTFVCCSTETFNGRIVHSGVSNLKCTLNNS